MDKKNQKKALEKIQGQKKKTILTIAVGVVCLLVGLLALGLAFRDTRALNSRLDVIEENQQQLMPSDGAKTSSAEQVSAAPEGYTAAIELDVGNAPRNGVGISMASDVVVKLDGYSFRLPVTVFHQAEEEGEVAAITQKLGDDFVTIDRKYTVALMKDTSVLEDAINTVVEPSGAHQLVGTRHLGVGDIAIVVSGRAEKPEEEDAVRKVVQTALDTVELFGGETRVSLFGYLLRSDVVVETDGNYVALQDGDNIVTLSMYENKTTGAGFTKEIALPNGMTLLGGDLKDAETGRAPFLFKCDGKVFKFVATDSEVIGAVFENIQPIIEETEETEAPENTEQQETVQETA